LEFKGQSDQTLKLFILDLKTGELLRTIDTGIPRAFAGSISSNAIDLERSRPSDSGTYQDDAVYIGYVQDYEGKGQYTKGGVLRLVLNDDITPANWKWSKVFVDGEIGPVTTSVVNLLDRQTGTLWLYFGEGRFFYKTDDFDAQRKLFGVKEPCYDKTTNTLTESCINDTFKQLQLLDLKDQTTTPAATLATTDKGWFVNMAATSNLDGAERIISNPTPDALGAVFFLSFAPTKDICGFGGTTFLWALDYKTGGKVTYTLQGKALVQVSTGEIKELKLADAFTEEGGRKSQGFMGIPPAGQGVMVITSPSPLKKFMHVQEQ
jgi:type IV pilus assembly protein PilY1